MTLLLILAAQTPPHVCECNCTAVFLVVCFVLGAVLGFLSGLATGRRNGRRTV